MRFRYAAIMLSILAASAVQLTAAPQAPSGADNAEMKAMADEDQRIRKTDQADFETSDRDRRKRTQALLHADALHTGKDYERAALIFQHGDAAEDFLLAHMLAMTAVAKGDTQARWMMAATLDRYLLHTGKPQMFGTQYQIRGAIQPDGQYANAGIPPGAPWTQQPYYRGVASDAMRAALGVPSEKSQQRQLEEMQPPTPR